MIAQVVFDLPLEGPFDYLIPEHLSSSIAVGMRVNVSFGAKPQIGFVVGLLAQSTFPKLKSIGSLRDPSAVFNTLDLTFARDFCAYYGCSLGEALGTILRNKEDHKPSIRRDRKPLITLYRCRPDGYAVKIQEIIDGYRGHSPDRRQSKIERGAPFRFLILVPDAFRAEMLSEQLYPLPLEGILPARPAGDGQGGVIKIGTRSSVFECDGEFDCVIMVDDEDASYKQEQMPMYETRQVLLTRSQIYGFDIAFLGISPSVELIAMLREKKIKLMADPDGGLPPARLVDLSNYRFIPGMLSPPVRDALDAALKAGKKGILVLNRKGSYRLTRCVDCTEILKCRHCDSPLLYSRSEGRYLCRHCTYTAAGDTVCPKCHKPSWRSMGIGVEQLQAELKKIFPQAKILTFERAIKSTVKTAKPSSRVITSDRRERSPLSARSRQSKGLADNPLTLQDFDILISTQAVLRFQGRWRAHVAAFIDFDEGLNRLDTRSAFNAFSLALHISSMALEAVFIQTRSIRHYVLQSLSSGKTQIFYDEELKLRNEFGFSPFKHWVKIGWRGKAEKSTYQAAWQVYNVLNQKAFDDYTITPPLADEVGRKRDQFRFNVMVQTQYVPSAVAFIKSSLAQMKRPSRVIVTINVDP